LCPLKNAKHPAQAFCVGGNKFKSKLGNIILPGRSDIGDYTISGVIYVSLDEGEKSDYHKSGC
jgi:hypothetical protein